ncbi:hypothetical protein L8Q74_04700 [Enterobacter roggenkampii]|nr:hypothetical protein [Enterobacter roggenkampii]
MSISEDDQNRLVVPALNQLQSSDLSTILQQDAEKYYYCSLVSFAEAIRGCHSSAWSWSIIKLYYSAFFAARALLALEKIAVCFIGKSEKYIIAKPNELLRKFPKQKFTTTDRSQHEKKQINGTHGSVMYLFEETFVNNLLLSQDIDNLYPSEWLVRERETANYRTDYFKDPTPPSCMQFLSQHGAETLIPEYKNDTSSLYTFDEAHAIIAYPCKLLSYTFERLEQCNAQQFILPNTVERKDFLNALLSGLPICLSIINSFHR